jgi:hypothetical protein
MRSTMIYGNRNGSFTLYCYIGDNVVFEETFTKLETAQETGTLFLDNKLELEPA